MAMTRTDIQDFTQESSLFIISVICDSSGASDITVVDPAATAVGGVAKDILYIESVEWSCCGSSLLTFSYDINSGTAQKVLELSGTGSYGVHTKRHIAEPSAATIANDNFTGKILATHTGVASFILTVRKA